MNANSRDSVSVPESHVSPRLARVGRFIHAVALHDVAAEFGLAHADENNIGVGFAHGDSSNRGALDLPVGNRLPGEAAIVGLPQAAAGGAEVVFERSGSAAGAGDRT